MEELETLDSGMAESQGEVTPQIQKLSSEIAPWVKTVAIINLVVQGINLITVIQYPDSRQLMISLVAAAISIALYITLLNWGTAMEKLGKDGSASAFSESMVRQKAFWIFFGILWILIMILVIYVFYQAFEDPRGFQRMLNRF